MKDHEQNIVQRRSLLCRVAALALICFPLRNQTLLTRILGQNRSMFGTNSAPTPNLNCPFLRKQHVTADQLHMINLPVNAKLPPSYAGRVSWFRYEDLVMGLDYIHKNAYTRTSFQEPSHTTNSLLYRDNQTPRHCSGFCMRPFRLGNQMQRGLQKEQEGSSANSKNIDMSTSSQTTPAFVANLRENSSNSVPEQAHWNRVRKQNFTRRQLCR